jgi:hypothetical protein
MLMQEGARAELEGITFTGSTGIGASENAPAISMLQCHQALAVADNSHVHMKGEVRHGQVQHAVSYVVGLSRASSEVTDAPQC